MLSQSHREPHRRTARREGYPRYHAIVHRTVSLPSGCRGLRALFPGSNTATDRRRGLDHQQQHLHDQGISDSIAAHRMDLAGAGLHSERKWHAQSHSCSGSKHSETAVRPPRRVRALRTPSLSHTTARLDYSGPLLRGSTTLLPVLRQELLDVPRIEFPGPEIRISQNLPVQRNRRVHTLDDEHVQRPSHARAGLGAVLGAHN